MLVQMVNVIEGFQCSLLSMHKQLQMLFVLWEIQMLSVLRQMTAVVPFWFAGISAGSGYVSPPSSGYTNIDLWPQLWNILAPCKYQISFKFMTAAAFLCWFDMEYDTYHSLAKKGPWAEHLTSLPKKGGCALSTVSIFNHERAPTSCLQQLEVLEANNWTQSNVQHNHQRLRSWVLTAHNALNGTMWRWA